MFEFNDELDDHLVRDVQRGDAIERFLRTDIGKFLHERARQDYADAVTDMITASEPEKIRAAQERARVVLNMFKYLNQGLTARANALETIRAANHSGE